MSLGLEMHLCPIVSSIKHLNSTFQQAHTIFMLCTISHNFFFHPLHSAKASFHFARVWLTPQPIISYTASTHLIFAPLSNIHPIIPLLIRLVLIHSKVIVYRFHGMIIFNIPINFIHILLAIETVLLFLLYRVCIITFFFVPGVCAKLSINIIFIIFILLQIFLPLCNVMISSPFSLFTQLLLLKHYALCTLHTPQWTSFHVQQSIILTQLFSKKISLLASSSSSSSGGDDVVYKTHHRCVLDGFQS